ncbi:MAG: hypothetical protein WA133_10520 [Syntrophales bacterium]
MKCYIERFKESLYMIAQDFYSSPEAAVPEACGSNALVIVAYSFREGK